MQWLSLGKLLRIQRLVRINARARNRTHEAGRLPRHVVVQKMVDISKLLLAFVMWSHLCACLYWFIGRIQPHHGDRKLPWVHKLLIDQPELQTAE